MIRMYVDIVMPTKNEEKLIETAKILGYSKLFFAYNLKDIKKGREKLIKIKSSIKNEPMILCTDKKEALKAKSMNEAFICKTTDDIRDIIEKNSPEIIFGIENSNRKDFIHHRNSGLNHIFAKIAQEKNVTLGFSFNDVLSVEGFKRSIILGRITQNIKLCRKYKVKTKIFSFASSPYQMRSPTDLISFFEILGMHHSEAKKSIE